MSETRGRKYRTVPSPPRVDPIIPVYDPFVFILILFSALHIFSYYRLVAPGRP